MKVIRPVVLITLLTVSCLFAVNTGAVEVGGEITVDTVWSKNVSPYIATEDVIVLEDVTLTIEPGVTIEFQKTGSSDGFHLEVQGELKAEGSESDPILFTIDDKGYHWGHIVFTDTCPPWSEADGTGSVLKHCIVEYAGNGRVDTNEKAAVRIESSSPLIENCVIRYSKNDGIRAVSGIQTIRSNRIHDTVVGIELVTPDNGIVTNNYLIGNEQGIYVESAAVQMLVSGNTVVSASSKGQGAALGVKLTGHDTLSAYRWKQVSGSSADLSETDLDSETLAFTVPEVDADDTLTFQLTVTDDAGLKDADTVDVGVTWENTPPAANAGEDQTVLPGTVVTLDGYESSDLDDGIATYEWIQTSGGSVELNYDESLKYPAATFDAPAESEENPVIDEVLIFQLTVTDAGGLKNMDSIAVTVQSPEDGNGDPVADAGAEMAPVGGLSVNLDGTGSSDPDGDGTIISYFWEQVDGPSVVEINDAASQIANFRAPGVDANGESLAFKLTVTDDHWAQSTDTVFVNVVDERVDGAPASNEPPVAEAGSNQYVGEGEAVTLIGTGSDDPEGGVLTYQWAQIAGIEVSLQGSPVDPNASFQAPDDEVTENETLVFQLTVTDEGGLRSKDQVTVVVIWSNDPPTANAGENQDVLVGDVVQLDGLSSTDPDDGIETYTWLQVEVTEPTVTLHDNQTGKAYFTAPALEEGQDELDLVFQLRVVDHQGAAASAITHVKVNGPESGPAADAGPGQMAAYGANVALDGSGSSDPDGEIVTWHWEQIEGDPVTLLNAATATAGFTAPAKDPDEDFKILNFILTVTDDDGLTDVDTVLVNVCDDPNAGTPPVADAGPDQTATVGEDVTLDGGNSYDPDTLSNMTITLNDFTFQITEGLDDDPGVPGNLVGVQSAVEANSPMTFTSNNLINTDGNFTVFLFDWQSETLETIATSDNWWGTTLDEEIDLLIHDRSDDANLPDVNYEAAAGVIADTGSSLSYPPIAEAGDEQAVDPDTIVTLSCEGGYDPDGSMTFQWSQTEGPTVDLRDADLCEAYFVAPEITDEQAEEEDGNVLTFKLVVTDPYGFYDEDSTVVNINQTEDDDQNTHSTSGCFIQTMSALFR